MNSSKKRKMGKTGIILTIVSILFVILMLVLPLVSVLANSLSKGFGFYFKSLSTKYVVSALGVTLIATVIAVIVNTIFGLFAGWLLTKFSFRGRQVLATLIDIPFSISPVIAGLAYIMTFVRLGWATPFVEWLNQTFGWDIQIVFALPGVVLATIFVTFPFVSREIIPVLNAQGRDEEEAAALMGAKGFTIFRKITFPHIKWATIYGIILCASRALGEFGAVNALSKTRGKTFTLPLEIDALYLDGSSDSIVAAFSVSSLLVIIAIVVLILRSVFENREKNVEKRAMKKDKGIKKITSEQEAKEEGLLQEK
ncbi:MAG: sulfate ABC transporter permease [Eubacterium sp.]|nr:sulfate ABC transporter permease [Eubacterium sp.]